MPFSYFDDAKLPGYHTSIITTFSVDPPFYDANIQYRLRAAGCTNNLMLADSGMLQRALESFPEGFVHAGRKYLIYPVASQGCFHPKLLLRYGKTKARLVLGSANATSAGWGSNREIVASIGWAKNSEDADNELQLGLIASAHDWLLSRIAKPYDPDFTYKLQLLESQSPWLADAQRLNGPQSLADGTLIELMLSEPGFASGIADRFLSNIEGEVHRLTVISPYWDDRLAAFRRLQTELGQPSTHIFLTRSEAGSRRQSTFPLQALEGNMTAQFHPLGGPDSERFLHAKLILVETEDYDFVLFGSANCSVAALGLEAAAGSNFEAAYFRRLPRGVVTDQLKLDYSKIIPLSSIEEPEEKDDQQSEGQRFHPGRMEKKGNKIFWSCPSSIAPAGSVFEIGQRALNVNVAGGQRPFVEIDTEMGQSTLVVRVRTAEGELSRPVIVSEPDLLRAAAPNPLASNLQRKLDSVLSGESDLITLARDVHRIFQDEEGEAKRRSTARSGGRGESISRAAGQDYDSPEEFREAFGFKADLNSEVITHPENPALQIILKIVLNGIVHLNDSGTIDQDDDASLDDLNAGEDQDDVGDSDSDNEFDNKASAATSRPAPAEAPTDREHFERNRAALIRTISNFEAYVEEVGISDEPIELEFVTRTLFMIYLMLYGCCKPYNVDGKEEFLIPFSGVGTSHQSEGFLLRSAKLINRIWGSRFKDGLMARVELDLEDRTLPVPILTLIILSRWILAAILAEARSASGAKGLAKILDAQVPKMYQSTAAFLDLDSELVAPAIETMAKQVGVDRLQAGSVQATVTELSNPSGS